MGIPAHLDERNFRRFEPVIFAITQNWPRALTLVPHPLAPHTYASRLRDAMRSFTLYGWTSSIDLERFRAIRQDLVITEQKDQVVIRHRSDSPDELLKPIITTSGQNLSWTLSDVIHLAVLLHKRLIEGTFDINLPYKLVADAIAAGEYDVTVINNDNYVTLL